MNFEKIECRGAYGDYYILRENGRKVIPKDGATIWAKWPDGYVDTVAITLKRSVYYGGGHGEGSSPQVDIVVKFDFHGIMIEIPLQKFEVSFDEPIKEI